MSRAARRYLLLGLLAYLVFLAQQMPASLALSWLQSRFGDTFVAYGVSGTLWQGRIQRLDVAGRSLRDVDWRWLPGEALLGRIGVALYARVDDGYVQAELLRGLDGDLLLRDVDGRLGMPKLLRLVRVPGLKLGGELLLHLERLELDDDGRPVAARGRLAWLQAVTLFPQRLSLGDLQAVLSETDQGLRAQLSDAGGPLVLDGELLLSDAGRYTLELQLAARQRNTPLARALRMLGRPDAKGRVRLKQSGSLAELGLAPPGAG